MSKLLKVGILGTGDMAQVHVKALSNIPDVEVVAVCGTDTKKAESFCNSYLNYNAQAYESFDSMLNVNELDILYICIPPFAHHGQLEKAALKGINIFIEKPIALDSQRGKSMVEAIRKAGVKSQVGYHLRFGHATRELQRLFENGETGKPTLFQGRFDCNALHSAWWMDKERSGGQILEQIIHTYDMAVYLLGEPQIATGFLSNVCHEEVDGYTVEDTSVSAVKFKNGALASITGSNCAVPMEWNNPFTVVFENVTAYFENPNKAEFVFTKGEQVTKKCVEGNDNPYLEEDKIFIEAVRGNVPNICTIEDGYRSLCLVEAVLKSTEQNGQPIEYKSVLGY
jgi:predicted dehydrogenase